MADAPRTDESTEAVAAARAPHRAPSPRRGVYARVMEMAGRGERPPDELLLAVPPAMRRGALARIEEVRRAREQPGTTAHANQGIQGYQGHHDKQEPAPRGRPQRRQATAPANARRPRLPVERPVVQVPLDRAHLATAVASFRPVFGEGSPTWQLVRHLRADPWAGTQRPAQLVAWLNEDSPSWWRYFGPSRLDVEAAFCSSWLMVEYAEGDGDLLRAHNRAQAEPLRVIDAYQGGDGFDLFMALLRVLARMAAQEGRRTILLPVERLGTLFGVNPSTISRWRYMASVAGVIEVVTPANKDEGLATEFAYHLGRLAEITVAPSAGPDGDTPHLEAPQPVEAAGTQPAPEGDPAKSGMRMRAREEPPPEGTGAGSGASWTTMAPEATTR